MSINIQTLPPEIISIFLEQLDDNSQIIAKKVCKQWNYLIQNLEVLQAKKISRKALNMRSFQQQFPKKIDSFVQKLKNSRRCLVKSIFSSFLNELHSFSNTKKITIIKRIIEQNNLSRISIFNHPNCSNAIRLYLLSHLPEKDRVESNQQEGILINPHVFFPLTEVSNEMTEKLVVAPQTLFSLNELVAVEDKGNCTAGKSSIYYGIVISKKSEKNMYSILISSDDKHKYITEKKHIAKIPNIQEVREQIKKNHLFTNNLI